MMAENTENNEIDFTVDQHNLYREEAFTDLKVASIRRLVPVYPDGSQDKSRTPVFIGSTQLMSPEGPLPLQAALPANNLQEAYEAFPAAMRKAMEEMITQLEKMSREEQKKEDSRIIVPGT
jgi:hypothetical protein